MNALLQNPYTEQWTAIGAELPKPKAVLCVSAHWYIQDAAVTISTSPRTIHDFGGFPRELYQVHVELNDRNICSRVHVAQHSPCAVVEPPDFASSLTGSGVSSLCTHPVVEFESHDGTIDSIIISEADIRLSKKKGIFRILYGRRPTVCEPCHLGYWQREEGWILIR